MSLEVFANLWYIGHKQEVNQVDIQCTTTDILQRSTYHTHLGEVVLITTEVHEYNGQQAKLSYRLWQVGPSHAQGTPLQRIQGSNDDDQYQDGMR